VFKKIARRYALALALAVLASPVGRTYAQSTAPPPSPTVVTGGDPQPTGESVESWIHLLPVLVALGLS
jgi:hypothetical protein